ncbi:MAG: hypothetical protein HYX69_04960 [Planctomycetia bacterium]|nr:hypothetical protein [Planctomycetia bacterium]
MKRYPADILATCVIPWDSEHRFDKDRFVAQVRFLRERLARRLYVFGTAGEGTRGLRMRTSDVVPLPGDADPTKFEATLPTGVRVHDNLAHEVYVTGQLPVVPPQPSSWWLAILLGFVGTFVLSVFGVLVYRARPTKEA